ncbi:FAD dependent oxidoreductase [Microdochium trichocladiopsis]|uniref:FAD dependent oxidoreductase n=1 Tax=Microdochium trichocladiopsis TaxID=1682393 RepID=A0A9P8YFA6_9PEZI|nr:FAD dependent oxidoreductase [Microdochium trichocladiopsis]KAH7035952.1 FAD dependent oxidoreductase [Microdochium trichocladiopsis]
MASPQPPPQNRSILIIGGGTFGLSTALSLARATASSADSQSTTTTTITVLEKDTQIPSRFSAGHDLNKIIRAEYADPFYTDLSVHAIRKWQTDPLYQPYYFERGYLNVISAAAPAATRQGLDKYRASLETHPAFRGKVRAVRGAAEVKRLVAQFDGPCEGWEGYYNEMAGYAHSRDAMDAVYRECKREFADRVKFCVGPEHGEVERLLFEGEGEGGAGRCVGAVTRDGQVHRADTTIVTAGAGVVSLMPQQLAGSSSSSPGRGLGLGITARCWGVVHIQLTPDEAAALRGIPVTMVRDLAFFFEPDRDTNKLKFCHMGGGYHHLVHQESSSSSSSSSSAQSSVADAGPPRDLASSQFVPEIDVQHIRRLLREALPALADRPLIDAHLCWIADSGNSDFVIDFVPGAVGKSLAVATGDSGHGFKMLPIIGDIVKGLLESGEQSVARWRWAVHERNNNDGSVDGVRNWRNGAGKDLADLVRAKL